MYIEETEHRWYIVLQEEMEEDTDPIAIEIPNSRGHDTKALAQFVMRAVESHTDLLDALHGMLRRYPESPGSYTPEGAAARAAIAKAERGV